MKNLMKLGALATMVSIPVIVGAKGVVIEDFAGSAISPNGRWVVSCIQGGLDIRDMQTGDRWTYDPDQLDIHMYANGLGNCISNDGVMVGTTRSILNASVWENGTWTALPVNESKFNNTANGITPDGKMICGCIGVGELSVDNDGLMLSPAVWIRNEDGTWGDPIALPHPERDFSNRIPQYITAICISDDGNTIVGQIRDYAGAMMQPIVYNRDAEGNWSYTLLASDLLNPTHVTFPDFVGDAPETPMIQDYMTQEEIDASSKAFQEWQESGSDDPAPEIIDFAAPEERTEYEADMKIYEREFLKWQSAYNRFGKAFNECLDNGFGFEFNNVAMSTDGKRYLTYSLKRIFEGIDEDTGQAIERQISYPYVFNLEDGTYTVYDSYEGLRPIAISDDYTVMVASDPHGYAEAYMYPKGDKNTLVSYVDYVRGISEADGQWMVDAMTESVDVYDPVDDRYISADKVITGMAACTPDMKAFISSVYYAWRDYGPDYITYVVYPGESGVDGIAEGADATLSILADGTLRVAPEVKMTEVYDFAGSLLFSTESTGDLRLPVASGLYLVKATTPAGVRTLKARF